MARSRTSETRGWLGSVLLTGNFAYVYSDSYLKLELLSEKPGLILSLCMTPSSNTSGVVLLLLKTIHIVLNSYYESRKSTKRIKLKGC